MGDLWNVWPDPTFPFPKLDARWSPFAACRPSLLLLRTDERLMVLVLGPDALKDFLELPECRRNIAVAAAFVDASSRTPVCATSVDNIEGRWSR